MDQLLQMIQSADPTDNQSDSVELLQLEGKDSPVCIPYFNVPIMFLSSSHQLFLYLFLGLHHIVILTPPGACNQMGPLIDQKLEDIDR